MSKTKFKSALAATLMALGVAGMATQVEARTYGGTFDPPIANVGFMVGAFKYEQNDACRLVEGVFNIPGSCDDNQRIIELSVNIFDNSPIPVLLSSLTFIPPLTTIPGSFYQHNGLPFAISTGIIGPRFDPIAFGPLEPLWLQFGFSPDPNYVGGGQPTQLPFVRLWTGVCDGPNSCINTTILTTARDVVFFEIPEPGTLALLFGALGAGLLARRRPRQV